MSLQRTVSIVSSVLACSICIGQEHIDNLKSALGAAEQLAVDGDFERAKSAYSLQLVLHSTEVDRTKFEGNELFLICDSLFKSIPYESVATPILGMTNCDPASLVEWFGDPTDRVPKLQDTGQLMWPKDVPMKRGFVDFVFDVDADGSPVNIQAVFWTDEDLIVPAMQWLEQVKYTPVRFRGEFAQYEHVRLRAEFGMDKDDS